MSADVAVIIVSYNTRRYIEPCLRSLLDQRGSLTQQVIVIDNASTDGSVDMIRSTFPTVEVIESATNLGFGAAVNLAARGADAEFLVLLNPDTVVLGNAIEALVSFARSNPGRGIYGGRTLKPDMTLEPSSCWDLPTVWSLAMFATGLSTVARGNRWLDPESIVGWARDSVREVGMVTGCLLLAPTTVWNELGGFDDRYFMYGEDADLASRARAAGYRPTICPQAEIIHEVGKASATRADKLLLLFRGKATFIRTHWTGVRRFIGLGLLKSGVALRALGASLAGRSGGDRPDGWLVLWRQRHEWVKGYTGSAV
jgi:N-acetylglucosaminyl-diphospho-decaprenol L-rhamnosyltransferase